MYLKQKAFYFTCLKEPNVRHLHGPRPWHGDRALEWQLINNAIAFQIQRCWLCCRKTNKKKNNPAQGHFSCRKQSTMQTCPDAHWGKRIVHLSSSETHISCWVWGCGWWAAGWHHCSDWAGGTGTHSSPCGQVTLQRILESQSDGALGSLGCRYS